MNYAFGCAMILRSTRQPWTFSTTMTLHGEWLNVFITTTLRPWL
jgi:hypothetical protein